MKANELRIGNYVSFNNDLNNIGKITCLVSDLVDELSYCQLDYRTNKKHWLINLKSIPLTEDWLFNFGFEKSKRGISFYYETNGVEIQIHGDKFVLSIHGGESAPFLTQYLAHHNKFVHQIQNLYFALTGEELTLKK